MGVSNPCEVCMNYEYNDETDSYECVLDVMMKQTAMSVCWMWRWIWMIMKEV